MQSHLSNQKEFIQFLFLIILFLLAGCNTPQIPFSKNSSASTPSSPNLGHLIYTASDNSLSAFHSTKGTKAWRPVDISDASREVLVTKDTVYAAGDKLYAFNAITGGPPIWSQPLVSNSLNVSNIVANNQGVYIVSSNIVFAFSAKSGAVLWRQELQPPPSLQGLIPDGGLESLAHVIILQNGILYTNATNSNESDGSFVEALQASHGTQLWSAELPDDIGADSLALYFQPVDNIIFDNNVLYGITGTDVGAFNIQNGHILWQKVTGRVDSMAITDNAMYITTYQNVVGSPPSGSYQVQLTHGNLSALNLPTGSADFTNGYTQSTIYMSGGLTGGDMMAVHLPDGTTKWHNEGTGKITFVMVLANNIYTVRDDGLVSLLNSHDGKTIWSLMLSKGEGTNIVTDGSKIYIPGDGLVVAIDMHTGKILWSAKTNGNRSIFTSDGFPLVIIGSN